MSGFIYIMSNPAFPDLIKIGKSKKDPTTDRVNELNQTGVPEPFKVEYYAFVEDEDYLERAVHAKLHQYRPNKNREFFKIDCLVGIKTIQELSEHRATIKFEEVFYVSPEKLAKVRAEQEKQREIERLEMERQIRERELEEARLRDIREEELRQKRVAQDLQNEKHKRLLKPSLSAAGVSFILLISFIDVFFSLILSSAVGCAVYFVKEENSKISKIASKKPHKNEDKKLSNIIGEILFVCLVVPVLIYIFIYLAAAS